MWRHDGGRRQQLWSRSCHCLCGYPPSGGIFARCWDDLTVKMLLAERSAKWESGLYMPLMIKWE